MSKLLISSTSALLIASGSYLLIAQDPDPFPKTLTLEDDGHQQTVRERGHTASVQENAT